MNELIKELAERASKEAFPTGSMAWMEVFAELIVLECCDIVRDEVQYISDFDKADAVVNEVKKRFRVERQKSVGKRLMDKYSGALSDLAKR